MIRYEKDSCGYILKKKDVNIKIKSSKTSSPAIKRAQYPLMLEMACTVRNVQGLSLIQIVFNFQLSR